VMSQSLCHEHDFPNVDPLAPGPPWCQVSSMRMEPAQSPTAHFWGAAKRHSRKGPLQTCGRSGRGDKGITYVHVPSLMAYMLGEPEIADVDLGILRVLAQSPEWCQFAINTLLDLARDRAGLSATDFLAYLGNRHIQQTRERESDGPAPI